MSKHYKKPIVRPEQARQWLARSEGGEALDIIARNDHFDIRTVKRQVGQAISERLEKEVRQNVFVAAFEKHFNDFVELSEKMRDSVYANAPILLDQDALSLLKGLREHLPRSPLWKYLDQYQAKFERLPASQNIVEELDTNVIGLSSGLRDKLNNVLFEEKEAHIPDLGEHSESRRRASTDVGSDIYKETLREIIISGVKAKIREDANKLPRQLHHKLKDELTTIILRRAVPGHCRYCPVQKDLS